MGGLISYKYLQDKPHYENLYDKQTVFPCLAEEKTVNSIFSEIKKKISKAELKSRHAGWYLIYSLIYFQLVESLAAQRYKDREKAIKERARSDQEKDNLLETSKPRKSYFCLCCGKDMAFISQEHMPRKKSGTNNYADTEEILFMFESSIVMLEKPIGRIVRSGKAQIPIVKSTEAKYFYHHLHLSRL